ncbi:MAG: hypothetical protein J6C37_03945 [Roseburia sp.]|nr:hypothetical protein [Roseburia sp.]
MKQYCRYCSHCHYADAVYCDKKQKTMSDSSAKSANDCKDFDFCKIDVFYMGDMNKTYKPRETKKEECDGQIGLFGKE